MYTLSHFIQIQMTYTITWIQQIRIECPQNVHEITNSRKNFTSSRKICVRKGFRKTVLIHVFEKYQISWEVFEKFTKFSKILKRNEYFRKNDLDKFSKTFPFRISKIFFENIWVFENFRNNEVLENISFRKNSIISQVFENSRFSRNISKFSKNSKILIQEFRKHG